MTKRINATMPDDLYNFAASQNRGNKSYVVNLALTCLRLFGSLETANNANEIAQLFDGNITEAQLAKCALAYLQRNYPNWEELIKGK